MTDQMNTGRPIKVADGIYWIGSFDEESNLQCNPFLVIQDEQAVVIDGGSRSDFAKVMLSIMQTGINPKNIIALIYQHYDPDLCGSMSNIIDLCGNPDLKILSSRKNNMFISYYIHKSNFHLVEAIEQRGMAFHWGGRTLRFIETPYSHNAGSFVTYDEKTQTLFGSDLFGSFSKSKDVFLSLDETCFVCQDITSCPNGREWCPLQEIEEFHRKIMPCGKALHYAIQQVKGLDIQVIASQHGSIINHGKTIDLIINRLEKLEKVGIDAIL